MNHKEDPYDKCVSEAHQEVARKGLNPSEVKGFIESVLSYDGLFEDFLKNPSSISRDIFSAQFTGHVCVACYTVELRQVLRSKTLVSNYKIAGFPYETAKRILTEYPILLVLDAKKLKDAGFAKLSGVHLFDPELHFGEAIVRVMVRERLDSDNMEAVSRIVRDEAPGVEIGVVTDAPGLSTERLAQTMQMQQTPQQPSLNKYVVNVPTLGIEDEVVKSQSDIAALQEALTRKWKQTGNPHREPKFTADYWLNSPMIQSDPNLRAELVREAETATYIVKEAHIEKEAAVKLQLPIQIEQDEQEIFDLLLSVNQKFNLGLTFRVAGGWVRDRLLGVQSKDIDIALDKMTGSQFCKYITKMTGKTPAIIAADAAKSKSLETATINLGSSDIPIDFVNLRKEVYEEGSRTPTMTFGTAEEDAERRDLTLNALFYNVNTGQVEDLTGKGLEDLQNLTLRTPMDPKQTFADDPLRVFRVLRFFAKFKGATIAEETQQAINDPEVQAALDPKNVIEVEVTDPKTGKTKIEKQRKISEERILVEWQKLHKGPQAAEALRIAHESGLWNKVFLGGAGEFESDVPNEVPVLDANGQPVIDPATGQPKTEKKYEKRKRDMLKEFHPFTMDQNNAWHVDNVFEHTMKVVAEYDKILRADGADDDERAKLLAAAFMHDLGKLDPHIIGQKEVEGIIRNTYHGHEDVSALAAEAILKGIKASNDEIELIRTVVQNHMIPHNKMTDKQINKMIRNYGKKLVRRIIQHAKADALSKPGADTAHYDGLIDKVQNTMALEPNDVRPLVPGGELMKLFPTLKAPSGFIKEIQERLQDIRDGNPTLTVEEALQQVENMRAEIMSKYQNWVPQKKVPQQRPQPLPGNTVPHPGNGARPKVVAPPQLPPTSAGTVPFNLSKQAEGGSMDMLCGKVIKHKFGVGGKSEHDAIFLMTDEGEEFKIRRAAADNPFDDDETLNELVGQRICAKGMIHARKLFVVSEYDIVNLDKDADIVEMNRRTPEDMTAFNVGDKVRHRKRGLAFEQIKGEVERIEHGLMYIKWDGVKEPEVFSLSDTVAVHGILQKL